jgi:DNA replication protein DnaC
VKLYMTGRFQDAYDSASLGLKNLVEGAVHDLIRRYRSNRATLSHAYDRLAHLKGQVLEIDVSRGHRMLADFSKNQITLLDVGNHEIVGRYTEQKLSFDKRNHCQVPQQFWPERSGFFQRNPDLTLPIYYDDETSEKWLYFLEAQQQQVDKKLRRRIWEVAEEGKQVPPSFIIGGPGTGKTCLLLNLLHFFHDICETRISISPQLADYIDRSTNARTARYRVNVSNTLKNVDLLLMDDPTSLFEMERALWLYRTGSIKTIVIAFDPLQLKQTLSDYSYEQLIKQNEVQAFTLNICYRQKENVGKTTKHVIDMIASSTPYSAKDRIEDHRNKHQTTTVLANQITFVNPAGYVQYYPETKVANIQAEVKRILRADYLLWRHYPGLLVVDGLTNECAFPEVAREALSPLQQWNYLHWISLEEIQKVKGLEFQHVFIFLSKNLYEEIQRGFRSCGNPAYNSRRLLRIPFSRAKDSLVTFVL